MRFTERNPSLKHQVILLVLKDSSAIHVSCNCLGKKTLGPVHDFADTVRKYNQHLKPEELDEWRLGVFDVQRGSPGEGQEPDA